MEFAGEFESHLTVLLHHSGQLADLQGWAQTNGLKCLHIVLDRGQCVSQPMLSRRGRGLFSSELAISQQLALDLTTNGFDVSRIKLEAGIHNEDIPQTDAEAAGSHANRYFEHHVKLLIDKEPKVAFVIAVAQRHSAHLSRNALRVRSDGVQERFVTQRVGNVGLATAQKRLNSLVEDLADLNQNISKIEQEFVVYDSNSAIDRGWIENKE